MRDIPENANADSGIFYALKTLMEYNTGNKALFCSMYGQKGVLVMAEEAKSLSCPGTQCRERQQPVSKDTTMTVSYTEIVCPHSGLCGTVEECPLNMVHDGSTWYVGENPLITN